MPAASKDAAGYHGDALVFFVNGHKVIERNPEPALTLLSYLRENLMLTGTKLGCAEGGCGACTVMVSKVDRESGKIIHHSVNACLAPLCSVHGMAVTTVEGIGSTKTKLHPVQERLAKSHGSQCGFCTPGIVMSMYTLLRNNPLPGKADLETIFQGNLCRCTGYRPILEGFSSFTKEFQCGLGEKCCRNQSAAIGHSNGANRLVELGQESAFLPYDPSQEPIFPSELQLSESLDKQSLHFQGESVSWYRPISLKDLLRLKAQHPNAKIVVGNTEVGVEVKFKNMKYDVLISTTNIPELNTIEKSGSGVRFGASVTLTQMEHTLTKVVNETEEYKTRIYKSILEILRWFAGDQIRNVASIGGNLVTASPISDLNPILLAAGCRITVASNTGGQREITMDQDFFISYRKTKIKPDEVLLYVDIPYTSEHEYFSAYKQAHRREDDIAIVNAAFKVKFSPKSKVIDNIKMCYGGMAPYTKTATKTMEKLAGKSWDNDLASEACDLLSEEMFLPPGTPGGMESYRVTLTTSLFFKFFLTVRKQLQLDQPDLYSQQLSPRDESATHLFHREPSHGVQLFEEVGEGQPKTDPVGRPIMHLSGQEHATGEAVYIDDIAPFKNELYMALVYSTKSHAKILAVDFTEALKMPGVHGHITHNDIPGKNAYSDEEILAVHTVHCQGQVIAAILADNKMHAQAAAKKVQVTYEEMTPIVTIEEAIEANSFIGVPKMLLIGDPEKAFDKVHKVIEGEVRMGGQEHFYMETHVSIAIPKGEHGEMEVYSSTQDVTAAQECLAEALGVPNNRIEVKVKRIGGAFGGKECQGHFVFLPAAIAANKYQRPVRCMLDRDEDMTVTGTRHPFLGKYKVAFTDDGKAEAVDAQIYSNAGYSLDLSQSVMEIGLMQFQGSYRFPHLRVQGRCCRTNTPSNTAFRGFGGPQALFIMETIMMEIAEATGIQPEIVRQTNLLTEGDALLFNQTLKDDNLQRCWSELMRKISLEERQKDVAKFNESNRWKKRGFSITPMTFGCGFNNELHLMQGGALVHVYKDGSVLLTHGGIEMGQGLHTKMAQVASRTLKIPISKIHISETSTTLVPNTSPTAGSVSSDINGMAILNACNTIMERLEPLVRENPKGSWEEWVTAAYLKRTSLSSTGFHKIPRIHIDWDSQSGDPVNYRTYGAAYSEVEIDCLTGDHNVLRTEIVMDIGQSLNPAVDIGQIEGAFIQGYGLFTLEEQRVSPSGFLYTKGPGAYKLPAFGDIPIEMNVSLLKNSKNVHAIYSSKALGEPPLVLATSVFFAIKEAIRAARKESELDGRFRLDSPATAERIRMKCQDSFTKKIPEPIPGTYEPWFVYM